MNEKCSKEVFFSLSFSDILLGTLHTLGIVGRVSVVEARICIFFLPLFSIEVEGAV